jgi:sodium-dependent dicarboxylate transporter 2/3/5
MFKNFHGFSMFEQYQAWKRERRERKSLKYRLSVEAIKLLVVTVVCFTLLFLPAELFGIPNLTLVEQRVIVIFAFATLMWLLEPVPAWTTSMGVVVLLLFT